MEKQDALPSLYLLEAKILSATEAIIVYEGLEAGLTRIRSLLQRLSQRHDGGLPPLGGEQGLTDLPF